VGRLRMPALSSSMVTFNFAVKNEFNLFCMVWVYPLATVDLKDFYEGRLSPMPETFFLMTSTAESSALSSFSLSRNSCRFLNDDYGLPSRSLPTKLLISEACSHICL
jgi:hypothetical protein